MKKTMRFFSLVIAILMICSLTTAAFAADGHTITINNPTSGYQYTAYQIFTGKLGSDGVLSDIKWASGVDSAALIAELNGHSAFAAVTDAKSVADVLSQDSTRDNANAVLFAEIASKHVSGGTAATYSDSKYTVPGLTDGYYLVVNNGTPNEENTTVSRFILEVVKNVEVSHKGTHPEVDKKIVEGDDKVSVNEASIGDAVNYVITGSLPSNILDYDTYFMQFRDELSKGLTYKTGSMKITLDLDGNSTTTGDQFDVTKYFFTEVTSTATSTKINVTIADVLRLDHSDIVADTGTITSASKIILTYSATLNEDAVINGANTNTVDLVYSNNPNVDGNPSSYPPDEPDEEPDVPDTTGNTPEATVETFTTGLSLLKTDTENKVLTGAEFQLTGSGVKITIVTKQVLKDVGTGKGDYYKLNDGTYTDVPPVLVDDDSTPDVDERTADNYVSPTKDFKLDNQVEVKDTTKEGVEVKVKEYVGLDGKVTFTGLGAGEYTLTETTTPDGYNTIDPINFQIVFDSEAKEFSCVNNSKLTYDAAQNMFSITVQNSKGNTLPSTGGVGTTLFYVFGGLMFAGAAVLLITKKRMAV